MVRQSKGRQGISRQVRISTFVHPAVSAGPSGVSGDKIVKVLGFRAHTDAVKESRERVLQRQKELEERAEQAAQDSRPPLVNGPELVVENGYVYEDYSMVVPEPTELDTDWLDVTQNKPSPSKDMVIIHALRDLQLSRLKGRRPKHFQTWRYRRQQEIHGWDPLIEPLTQSYLHWKYHSTQCASQRYHHSDSDSEPARPAGYELTLAVFELFTMETEITIFRPGTSTSAPVDLAEHGFLAKSPRSPKVAVGFRTLELFHRLRLRKASFSFEAFTKVLCDFYQISYRRYLRTVIADTYEIYLRILRSLNTKLYHELGWTGPEWRVRNSCPACCYELKDEPPMRFGRLWAHDGNNSLKRMLPFGSRTAADDRIYSDSDYFLPRKFVDRFANEVQNKNTKKQPYRQIQAEDEDDDENDDDDEDGAGPVSGVDSTAPDGVSECVSHWKAAAADSKKKSWSVFDETGIYTAVCQHSLVLWVCDMVRSGELAKYPLAILAKALDVLPPRSAGGMDIACGFKITARNSSLAPLIEERQHEFIVNAFHGYSHSYQCQHKNHPTVVKGTGLEDFETCERFFSNSNGLASVVRHCSAYRRGMLTSSWLEQWDEDKYASLGTFLLNNYKQALRILRDDVPALDDAKCSMNVTDADMDSWEAEQAEFFLTVGVEPEGDMLRTEYVELLQALQNAHAEKEKAHHAFFAHSGTLTFVAERPSSDPESYADSAAATRRVETRRRQAREAYDNLLSDVVEMETMLGVDTRWVPEDPEYQEAAKYLAERKYHRALNKVHKLVIQRLFELHKLNIAGTGYKVRTHIGKSLQTRCRTIRTAISAYNAAAAELSPPRAPLDWTEVSHYGFIEEFAMLKDTRNDIRDKPWAKPIYRELLKLRHRVARAQEEILRCNIQTRRLYTSICDQTDLFSRVLIRVRDAGSEMHGPLRDFIIRRQRINLSLLQRVQQIFALQGFTGDATRGTRLGSVEPIQPDDNPGTTHSEIEEQAQGENALSRISPDDSEDEEGDVEHDDEFTRITQGVENFVTTVNS